MPLSLWIALIVVVVFVGGVGVVTMINGIEATPQWMRSVACVIGATLVYAYVAGTVERMVDVRRAKRSRRNVAARQFDDDAAELEVHLEILEEFYGSNHPLTLRARYTQAHLLLVTGQQMRAMALLADVIADQLTVLGPDHPDTLRSLELLERHIHLVAPDDSWLRK
jgi:hypothetical protein